MTPQERAQAVCNGMFQGHADLYKEEIALAIKEAVLAEREACASVAEAPAWSAPTSNGEWALREVAKVVATQIRARGNS